MILVILMILMKIEVGARSENNYFDNFDQNLLLCHDVDLRAKVNSAGSFEVPAAQMPPLNLLRLSSSLTSKTISIRSPESLSVYSQNCP